MAFNVLEYLGFLILRKKYPNIELPHKVWFYPVSVIITALIFAALVVNSALEDPVEDLQVSEYRHLELWYITYLI